MRLNPALDSLEPFSYCGTDYPTRLDANESCVPLSEGLRRELADAILSLNLNCYPDDRTVALRQAFGKAFSVDPDCVVPGNGSDELINMIVGRLIPYQGLVLGVERDFGSYWSNAAIFGRRVEKLPRREDMTFTADDLLDGVRRYQPDLLIFSNPNNPSGSQLTREEVIRVVEEAGCLVVVDEAYMDFSDQSLLPEFQDYANLLILRTCSKAFGMASLRLGFAVGQKRLVDAVKAVKSPYNVNSLSQKLGALVLGHPQAMKDALETILSSRDALLAGVRALEGEFPGRFHLLPSATNFITLRMADGERLYQYLGGQGIAIRYTGGLARITCGAPEENQAVLREMSSYFAATPAVEE